MRRNILAVSLEEVRRHLAANNRQDIKIVAPERLNKALFEKLLAGGKVVKQEHPLEQDCWKHSERSEPNLLCESNEFTGDQQQSEIAHSFALSFANEYADQDDHYHKGHIEIYFSEHRMEALYRWKDDNDHHSILLEDGGAIVFNAGVVHRMRLCGMTLVLEVPSVKDDKINEPVIISGGA